MFGFLPRPFDPTKKLAGGVIQSSSMIEKTKLELLDHQEVEPA
jgi:hypothetical protein